MGDVVNLNKFRKAQSKDRKEAQASENRRKFGRTKAEKSTERQLNTKAQADLDSRKLDDTSPKD